MDPGYYYLAGLFVVALGVVVMLFNWLSGPRGETTFTPRIGLFWKPPKPPEDEWQKWKDD